MRDRTERELPELADETEETPEANEKFEEDVDMDLWTPPPE